MDETDKTPEASEKLGVAQEPSPAGPVWEPEPDAKVQGPESSGQVPELEPASQVRAPEPVVQVEESGVRALDASIIDGEERSVDPRSVVVARLVGIPWIAGIALIPFVGVTVGWALGGVPTWLYVPLLLGWVVIAGCALLIGYRWPELHHRHLRYRVDGAGVRIRSGVLWRKVISIPTSRVQHTDVSQGPVQRHYGIATLTVYTAGTEGASIALSGLEHGVARRLRDHLLPDHESDGV